MATQGKNNPFKGLALGSDATKPSLMDLNKMRERDEKLRDEILNPKKHLSGLQRLQMQIARSQGKVRDRVLERLDSMSSYASPEMRETIKQLVFGGKQGQIKLANTKQYLKLMNYFINKGKKDLVTDLIEENIAEIRKNKDMLNQSLMLAARSGDLALFNKLMEAPNDARIVQDNWFVVDAYGRSVLHYAAEGGNAELIKLVADAMKHSYDTDATLQNRCKERLDGPFDPYRLRDDQLSGKIYSQNYIRPIHLISPNVAKELDAEYKMPDDGRPGTFTNAANYYIVDNKVLNRGFFSWLGAKLSTHSHSVEWGLLGGKALGGIPVANIADHAPNFIMNLGESATLVGLAAAIIGTGIASKNIYAQRKAKQYCVVSPYVFTPVNGTFTYPANYGDDKGTYNQLKNVATKNTTLQRRKLKEALRARDQDKITEFAKTKYQTSHALLSTIRQIDDLSFPKHPDTQDTAAKDEFKKQLFISLVDNIKYRNFHGGVNDDGIQLLNKTLDILYRRNEFSALNEVVQHLESRCVNIPSELKKDKDKDKDKDRTDWKKHVEYWRTMCDDHKANNTHIKIKSKYIDDALTIKVDAYKVKHKDLDKVHDFENEEKERITERYNKGKEFELIKAMKKYDFYKIQHILEDNHLEKTTKEVFHALQHMAIMPLRKLSPAPKEIKPGDAANPDVNANTETKIDVKAVVKIHDEKAAPEDKDNEGERAWFIYKLYRKLAEKAQSGKLLNQILDDMIHKIHQGALGIQVMGDLVEHFKTKVDTAANDTDKALAIDCLKQCALHATRAGDKKILKNALDALQKHEVNLLDVTDKQGNTLLHYAARAQDSKMVQFILAKTDIIDDFRYLDRQRKKEEGIVFKFRKTDKVLTRVGSGKIARNILQMPNRDGDTPAKLLMQKDALLDMDNFCGNTTGFRMEGNENLRARDLQHIRNVNLMAGVSAGIVALGLCSAWGIPGAIAGGKVLGSILAEHTTGVIISSDFTIGGGLLEGAFAVSAAKATEKGLMPAIRSFFRAIDKHISAYFGGNSMRVIHDYSDRLKYMSEQFLTDLNLNSKSFKNTEELGLYIAERAKAFLNREKDDPTRFLLATQACMKIQNQIVEQAFYLLNNAKPADPTLQDAKTDEEKTAAKDSISLNHLVNAIRDITIDTFSSHQSFTRSTTRINNYENTCFAKIDNDKVKLPNKNIEIDRYINILNDEREKYVKSSEINSDDFEMLAYKQIDDKHGVINKQITFLNTEIASLENSLKAGGTNAAADTELKNHIQFQIDAHKESLNGLDLQSKSVNAEKHFVSHLQSKYVEALAKRQEIYQQRFNDKIPNDKALASAKDELLKTIRKEEGNKWWITRHESRWWWPWQLVVSKVSKEIENAKPGEAIRPKVMDILKKIRHPEPEKAINMMNALAAYEAKQAYIFARTPTANLANINNITITIKASAANDSNTPSSASHTPISTGGLSSPTSPSRSILTMNSLHSTKRPPFLKIDDESPSNTKKSPTSKQADSKSQVSKKFTYGRPSTTETIDLNKLNNSGFISNFKSTLGSMYQSYKTTVSQKSRAIEAIEFETTKGKIAVTKNAASTNVDRHKKPEDHEDIVKALVKIYLAGVKDLSKITNHQISLNDHTNANVSSTFAKLELNVILELTDQLDKLGYHSPTINGISRLHSSLGSGTPQPDSPSSSSSENSRVDWNHGDDDNETKYNPPSP